MADTRQVTGTINARLDSKERVAYDLMIQIAHKEMETKKDVSKDRAYWFKLYEKCYHVVLGRSLTDWGGYE